MHYIYLTARQNFLALFVHSTKILFTQATIDCLFNKQKTENALYNEAVILNYIDGDPISRGLSN